MLHAKEPSLVSAQRADFDHRRPDLTSRSPIAVAAEDPRLLINRWSLRRKPRPGHAWRDLRTLTLGAIVALWVVAAPSLAQTTSFSQIGEVPEGDESRQEELEAAIAAARWTFGNTKIDPFVGLTDGGWIRDAFDRSDRATVDDFTLTLSAGLTLFHQVGSDSTIALWALPEYVWWQDLEDRRRLNGRYGLGWYGYYSRVALELEARRDEEQLQATPEVRELTSQRQDHLRAATAIDLYKSLAWTLEVSSREFESLIDVGALGAGSPFSRLDRTEEVLQTGIRMRLRDAVDVEVGVFDVQTDFPAISSTLANEGDGLYLAWILERDRFSWDTRIEQRQLQASFGDNRTPGSFPEFDDALGHSALSFTSRNERRGFGVYLRRGLFYSLGSEFAYLVDDTLGVWWSSDFGRKTNLRLWAENSQLDYEPFVGSQATREDDLDRLGATFTVELPYGFGLQVGWLEQSASTTPPVQIFGQRDISALTIALGFRAVQWP